MTDEETRILYRVQAQMELVVSDVADLKKDMKGVNKTLSEASGGWKAIVALSSFAAVVGGLVVQVAHWFLGR